MAVFDVTTYRPVRRLRNRLECLPEHDQLFGRGAEEQLGLVIAITHLKQTPDMQSLNKPRISETNANR